MKSTLLVLGNPIPQPRPKFATRGKFVTAYVPKTHPVHEYRRQIAEAADEAGCYFEGAVRIDVEIVFPRPASHFTKQGLKPSAPSWPRKWDIDNVIKAIFDALNKVAYADDSQIVEGSFTRGYSNERDATGYTKIIITNA